MGQRIVAFCDVCSPDVVVETKPYVVAIGNLAPRRVDLCDDHAKEYVVPLDELLREVGQPTEPRKTRGPGRPRAATATGVATAPSSGTATRAENELPRLQRLVDVGCPECGQEVRAASTLRNHLITKHNYGTVRASQAIDKIATERFGPAEFKCEYKNCHVTSETVAGRAAHHAVHMRALAS